ncbi:hypothetical protein [Dyella sp. 333MFSha]|uniref:hypothetical protein n=1 Tax=Dyella sp. 333MFSha TaxID=1798240 RepID=UPI00088AA86A|nr:hypothetical protein [Dyella sp. 333MFSha]SDF44025.1 hypothetical protein SAMN04515659_0962 [Dyella sp. 333MFSha]
MVVLRELAERLVWRVTLNRRLGEVFALPGGASLASRSAPWITEASWWGNHDAGAEASALFAAMHRDDTLEAAFRAHRLQRAGRLSGMPGVTLHAEALEIALVSHASCGTASVCSASIQLVRSLTDEGVLLTSQP